MTNEINKISKQLAEKVLQADLSGAQVDALFAVVASAKIQLACDGPMLDEYAAFPVGTRWDTKAALAAKLGSSVLRWDGEDCELGSLIKALAWAKHDVA